ncbi:hypothetical protein ONZ43_g6576 [Nemania bipapillata]|uniref:Uncharacterized protein n=1 Tax=Nemania bipapillata TaxID=110536 RepID=A0ACC2HZ07_9PEZI|nr:hypothetical protein ONZ43_g6576 [Nemania bipapillata]
MSTTYVTARPEGREHILLYPKGFVAVRILQLVLGIICLGLTAYTISVLPITGAALMLFTSLVTLISSIYILIAHFGPPKAYNYWAILGLDIFHVLFWLISFALLASQAAVLFSYTSYYYYEYAFTVLGSITAAAAGLGGVQWVVYVVALVLHSIALHRHRQAGLHAMPGVAASAPAVAAPAVAGAPVEAEKIPMETQTQPPQGYYPPPQQVYEVPYQQAQQPVQPQPQPQQFQQQQPTY